MLYKTKESLGSSELLKSVGGISIATKTMASMCPLAEVVSRSGISNTLPQLSLQIDPSLGQDYQNVVRGGDWSNIEVLDFYAPQGSFDVASSSPTNIVYLGLDTLMTDNFGRNTPLLIGLKGVTIKDREVLWQTVLKLFPNVVFMVSEKGFSMGEQQQLGKENVIPLALFDLSKNLPRITASEAVANRYQPPQKASTGIEDAKVDNNQKDQVRGYLAKYRAAVYGSEKFAVIQELSKILPDFNGIQNDELNSMVLSGNSGARVWTLSEIEEYINKK